MSRWKLSNKVHRLPVGAEGGRDVCSWHPAWGFCPLVCSHRVGSLAPCIECTNDIVP